MAQAGFGHLARAQDKLYIPKEMFATIIQDPIFDPFESLALGQHALVIGQSHGSETHAKTQLRVPKP